MPDADKVQGIGSRYQEVYQQVCEGVFSEDELSHNALEALIKDLQEFGDAPLMLIQDISSSLQDDIPGPLFNNTVDWKTLNVKLEKKAQKISFQTSSNGRGMELAMMACKAQVHAIRYGSNISLHAIEQETVAQYFGKVYEANFEGGIQLANHHSNADPELVEQRVAAMRPLMQAGIDYLARQAVHQSSVASLRRPPRKNEAVDLGENLLEIGV